MSKTKTKWESAALIGIIAMMSIGFLWTIVALFIGPKVQDPFVDDPAVERVRQVRENPRLYHQGMNIHGVDAAVSSLADFESKDREHEKLIPVLPDAVDVSTDERNPLLDSQMSRTYQPKRSQQEEDDLLAEDEEKTGWGWLADDVAKRRSDKEEASEEAAESKNDEEDERLAKEKDDKRREDAEQDRPVYFMDASFNSDSDEQDPYMRSVMKDDEASGAKGGQSSEEYAEANDAYSEDSTTAWDGSSHDQGSALAVRDPFTSDRDTSSAFGGQEWGMNSEGDNFSGMDYAEDAGSSRIIEAAEAGADRYAEPSRFFASDSMFNSGGGYTPQGVSASRGDSMFSGSGVFDGPSVSIVTPSVNPSAEIGNSYKAPTPSSSYRDDRRDDSGLSRPVTLPW